MSTAQDTPLPGTTAQEAAEALTDVADAASSTTTRSSTRAYTLFEEARSDTWTKLGEVEADTQDAALESLGEQKLKSGQRFVAVPSRFFRPVKPSVTTVTTISFD